jgi:hypothetical protein
MQNRHTNTDTETETDANSFFPLSIPKQQQQSATRPDPGHIVDHSHACSMTPAPAVIHCVRVDAPDPIHGIASPVQTSSTREPACSNALLRFRESRCWNSMSGDVWIHRIASVTWTKLVQRQRHIRPSCRRRIAPPAKRRRASG